MSVTSLNFDFLAEHSELMVKTASQAERYFRHDPTVSLTKLRRFAELIAEASAASVGVHKSRNMSQHKLVVHLEHEGVFTAELVQLFTSLRKAGNAAVHEDAGCEADALTQLGLAHELALWFHRSFGDGAFEAAPFEVPPSPAETSETLRGEVSTLREELDQEREVHEQRVVALLALAEQGGREYIQARVEAAQHAAARVELSEDETRELIDVQLRAAGWEVDSTTLRHGKGARPIKGRNLAISEWPTRSGPADYVLFCGLTPVGIVEAKRESKDVRGCLEQAKRYSRDFQFSEELRAPGGPWGEYKLPFLFATNGRPYMRQFERASGTWHLDLRESSNRRRALDGWMSPEGLQDLLSQSVGDATAKLESEDLDYLPLRAYQREAVRATERAIAAGQRSLLLAMATGTGKTRTCICLIYRLIKAGRFKRVLFLVDRRSLGDQALQAFDNLKLEQQRPFSKIYDVKELGDAEVERDTRLQIATIQAMVGRLDDDDGGDPPPVDQYDCIVIDECHRGYNLDREMSETEQGYRSAKDYVSKYRRVIDHFDAVKIGLTATPALHTTEIFGEPVYTYSYRQAVIEGFLIDHEPPIRITTALAATGLHWDAGEEVAIYRVRDKRRDLIHTPDEIDIDIDGFNRRAIVPAFNRAVCRELAKHIDPTLPGKTLIFCAKDDHADDVVDFMLEAFNDLYGPTPNDTVVKITGAADKPGQLIKRYKNERLPAVGVTVDLLTTGIDVPQIVNLVFLRRVRSRILYDQMIGRGTRLCEEIGKRYFRIFDAVDIYSALQEFTDMKPVVSDVTTSFADLIGGLETLRKPEELDEVCAQLLAKLQRKRRGLGGAKLDHFVTLAGGNGPMMLLNKMPGWAPKQVLEWWREHPALVKWLDTVKLGKGPIRLISDADDEVIEVSQGYGEHDGPGDYLESFKDFIETNLNTIPALLVVTQRPRDLTRAQLVQLREELAQAGYTEAQLESAWRQTTNQDIAASVIGFIRGQALGSPLIPYTQRVQAAVTKILGSRQWTQPQRKWLERIGKQLGKQRAIDRAMLDEDAAFRSAGGFKRLDKQFGGELEGVLAELNEAVWEDAG